ncbi:hypothetical protein PR048_030155 [Dryococelus australis]|uniref:Uncharacterized protein n=1 Tax=Dryococelus australis TaxID=614101 RepID=A0ABQ9GAW1_9NEOP|nr:hypothetical protein PR048_030155 [Dryococelus australis]
MGLAACQKPGRQKSQQRIAKRPTEITPSTGRQSRTSSQIKRRYRPIQGRESRRSTSVQLQGKNEEWVLCPIVDNRFTRYSVRKSCLSQENINFPYFKEACQTAPSTARSSDTGPDEMDLIIKSDLILCMVDGKSCNAVSSCSSIQKCYLCGAKPREVIEKDGTEYAKSIHRAQGAESDLTIIHLESVSHIVHHIVCRPIAGCIIEKLAPQLNIGNFIQHGGRPQHNLNFANINKYGCNLAVVCGLINLGETLAGEGNIKTNVLDWRRASRLLDIKLGKGTCGIKLLGLRRVKVTWIQYGGQDGWWSGVAPDLDPVYRLGIPYAYKTNMTATALPSKTIPRNSSGGSKKILRENGCLPVARITEHKLLQAPIPDPDVPDMTYSFDFFPSEVKLLVDMPKQQSGNTNDGNSPRTILRKPEKSAEITGLNPEFIKLLGWAYTPLDIDYIVEDAASSSLIKVVRRHRVVHVACRYKYSMLEVPAGKRNSGSTARRFSALCVGATRHWSHVQLSPVSLCLECEKKKKISNVVDAGHIEIWKGSSTGIQLVMVPVPHAASAGTDSSGDNDDRVNDKDGIDSQQRKANLILRMKQEGEDDHENSIDDDYEHSVYEVSDQKDEESTQVPTHFTYEFPSKSGVKMAEGIKNTCSFAATREMEKAEEEMQPWKFPDVYLAKKVLKLGNGRAYIKWWGFPEPFNSRMIWQVAMTNMAHCTDQHRRQSRLPRWRTDPGFYSLNPRDNVPSSPFHDLWCHTGPPRYTSAEVSKLNSWTRSCLPVLISSMAVTQLFLSLPVYLSGRKAVERDAGHGPAELLALAQQQRARRAGGISPYVAAFDLVNMRLHGAEEYPESRTLAGLQKSMKKSHTQKDPAPKEISDIDTRDIICWKTFPVHEGEIDNTAVISVFGNASMFSRKKLKFELGDQIWLYRKLVGTTGDMHIHGHAELATVGKRKVGGGKPTPLTDPSSFLSEIHPLPPSATLPTHGGVSETRGPKTQDSTLKIQDPQLKTIDSRPLTQDSRSSTQCSRALTQNPPLNTLDAKPMTHGSRPLTQDSRLKTLDR